jgi:hypothetical protein
MVVARKLVSAGMRIPLAIRETSHRLDALLRARGWGQFDLDDCATPQEAYDKTMRRLRELTERFGGMMPDNADIQTALEVFLMSCPPARLPERPRQSFQDWAAGLPLSGGFELPRVL